MNKTDTLVQNELIMTAVGEAVVENDELLVEDPQQKDEELLIEDPKEDINSDEKEN